jgi:hypothetical protein
VTTNLQETSFENEKGLPKFDIFPPDGQMLTQFLRRGSGMRAHDYELSSSACTGLLSACPSPLIRTPLTDHVVCLPFLSVAQMALAVGTIYFHKFYI